eukprot:Gregarina_sp_Pseudo_9__4062@NODE_41_length_5268_cov_56_056607_g38_i0_p4_GENE_NODE_41_length_5268_cov_56_056607_g38_i0NODE_41_length_5268_cov_56_056607_g38_i0_p4_ORF_typecomplete_len289_score43_04HOOK/PF05622_12/0_0043TTKRSYEDQ/PF10212_9/0_0072HAP1_N/PF04849_13/0_0079Rootletin/PF15035_6/0_0091ZapB/PF06005_12/0_015ZapB/PF06005_12/6_5e03DUF2681/PF10883_8/0_12TSC22/PF01166_18/0_68TSC22/PF01166_18/1_4e02DivIVA/PF05103_13/0_12Csm1_N/PF18504_1/0_26JIP_LZII/PF16471_5/0_37AAA_18/PF13238_6/5_1AAA_18/PF132
MLSAVFMNPPYPPTSCKYSSLHPSDMGERPHSPSTSGTSSRSVMIEPENQVCWDIETYRLVTKRVEDLESENRMLRSKVVVMAAENATLRERLESEANTRSLSQLLDQLRDSGAGQQSSPEPPQQFLACDYDHAFRGERGDTETQSWSPPPPPPKVVDTLDTTEEPKFWDIQSVISGSLVGDRIMPQHHPKFPLLDENTNSFQPSMWNGQNVGRLNEHGTYLTMPFNETAGRRFNPYVGDGDGDGAELPENLLRRRTRRRGRRGGKKHGGRRKKQENSELSSPFCTAI